MNHQAPPDKSVSVHDYDAALQGAVSWLGDRYLLATPQPKRAADPTRAVALAHRNHDALVRRSSLRT